MCTLADPDEAAHTCTMTRQLLIAADVYGRCTLIRLLRISTYHLRL